MPIARSGILWRRIFFVLLIAISASYYWYAAHEFPHGGSAWGLAYGIAGTLLILLLAFFGIRKRWYRSTFGTLEQWLQSHIYLGVLVLVILIFHTGGRFNDRSPWRPCPRRHRRRQRHRRRDSLCHRAAAADRSGERADGRGDLRAAQPAREADGAHRLGTLGRRSSASTTS